MQYFPASQITLGEAIAITGDIKQQDKFISSSFDSKDIIEQKGLLVLEISPDCFLIYVENSSYMNEFVLFDVMLRWRVFFNFLMTGDRGRVYSWEDDSSLPIGKNNW